MKMNKSNTARRAWNILRLAILWARKGNFSRRVLMLNLPKYIKSLRHGASSHNHRRGAIGYGERQLSFDRSPAIHVRMHRPSSLRFKLPSIPCINRARVDFDYNFEDDVESVYYDEVARKSFLNYEVSKGDDDDDEAVYYGNCAKEVCGDQDEKLERENQEIDMRAEEFIAKFYEQMKLQRQISYLKYHDRHLIVDQQVA